MASFLLLIVQYDIINFKSYVLGRCLNYLYLLNVNKVGDIIMSLYSQVPVVM